MTDESKTIRVCVFTTLYEAITSILKDQLSIEEMKRMLSALDRYVTEEERRMRR
jgi:aspartate-semialdehyde dehydrogenase